MNDELDIETYLFISQSEFKIYLFDKKNLINIYKKEIKYINKTDFINLHELDQFLEHNIFKIEKLAGSFIKKIFLIIDNNKIKELSFGIKKKNYEKKINKNFVENILIDAKDLFRENYQNDNIMHILISRYLDNENSHFTLNEDLLVTSFVLRLNLNTFLLDLFLK